MFHLTSRMETPHRPLPRRNPRPPLDEDPLFLWYQATNRVPSRSRLLFGFLRLLGLGLSAELPATLAANVMLPIPQPPQRVKVAPTHPACPVSDLHVSFLPPIDEDPLRRRRIPG